MSNIDKATHLICTSQKYVYPLIDAQSDSIERKSKLSLITILYLNSDRIYALARIALPTLVSQFIH